MTIAFAAVVLGAGSQAGAQSRTAPAAADSARFQGAFDQAVWAWGRFGKRDGLDTISVRYDEFGIIPDAMQSQTQYFFYPKQLDRPADRPVLQREKDGAGRRAADVRKAR